MNSWSTRMLFKTLTFFATLRSRPCGLSIRSASSINKKIDFSKFPKLQEKDLNENFVRGDGPGGQATNTTNNCVVLKHKPTNIVVKFHGSRSLPTNREEARKILLAKLDELYNNEDSVANQRKRLEKTKTVKAQSKSEKIRKLKAEFKQNLEVEKSRDVE